MLMSLIIYDWDCTTGYDKTNAKIIDTKLSEYEQVT